MMGGDTKIWEGLFSPSIALPPAAKVHLGLDIIVNQVKEKYSLTDAAQCLLSSLRVLSGKLLKIKSCLTVMKTDVFTLTSFILDQSDDSREP